MTKQINDSDKIKAPNLMEDLKAARERLKDIQETAKKLREKLQKFFTQFFLVF